jgi:hypothetical protein
MPAQSARLGIWRSTSIPISLAVAGSSGNDRSWRESRAVARWSQT